jgi:hypothetical protein
VKIGQSFFAIDAIDIIDAIAIYLAGYISPFTPVVLLEPFVRYSPLTPQKNKMLHKATAPRASVLTAQQYGL